MTAGTLDRIGTALTARPATVFFDALTAADEHIRRDDDLAWTASFAPAITAFAKCPCGSTYEVRGDRLDVTDDEKLAAAEAHADMYGHAMEDHDLQAVDGVIAAIASARASESWEVQENWNLVHEGCDSAYFGDDL